MRIRATQKLQEEEVPSKYRSWVVKIISAFNSLVSDLIPILNGGIVFGDNFVGMDHVFDFKYQSDAISLPVGFLWTYKQFQPRALVMVSATADGDPVNLSASWRFTETNQVQLVSIVQFTSAPAVAALTANVRYKIRVRVTP